MRKVVIFILCILSLFSFSAMASYTSLAAYFSSNVSSSYETYEIQESIVNEDFTFVIVRGIANGKGAWGFVLENNIKSKYSLSVRNTKHDYVVDPDEDGNYYVLALKLDYVYTIDIVLEKNDSVVFSYTVNPISVDYTAEFSGQNKGCEFDKLNKSTDFVENLFVNIYVIVFGLIGIISFYIVFKVSREYTYTIDELGNIVQFHKGQKVAVIRNKIKVVRPTPAPQYEQVLEEKNDNSQEENIIEEPKRRFIDEEEIEATNNAYVKKLLTDKGYMTIYNVLTDDEKNDIMVELMMLKNEGEITDKEYSYEVVELWKK